MIQYYELSCVICCGHNIIDIAWVAGMKRILISLITVLFLWGAVTPIVAQDAGGPLNPRRPDVVDRMQARLEVSGVRNGTTLPYTVVDTGQSLCFDARQTIACPRPGERFYGQDACYHGPQPAYRDNKDGTVSDLNTGLMWASSGAKKVAWQQAVRGAADCRVGGHDDWRLPTIKEMYSLILFSGTDPDLREGGEGLQPFIDARYFPFQYGQAEDGDRIIDSQFATATRCVTPIMHGIEAMFGVNFADGRIKAYPIESRGRRTKIYSAAIAPVFHATAITNEGGTPDYPFYWTGTTHASLRGGMSAVYISFGRALGFMEDQQGAGKMRLIDVHGAGAQRSDPKSGDPRRFATGRGPQGDVVRIHNFVRCVRTEISSTE